MSFLSFTHVGITAISAVVPPQVIDNSKYTHFMTPEEAASVIRMTGIAQRRFADEKTCSSDLCVAAAERLFSECGIDKNGIDLIIFVSQTPDYRTPPTSMMLQDRLGLSKDVGAYDINLGCSGYIYGLANAFLYASQPTMRKVLLLNGETKSKAYSTKDKGTSLLFGDGATATIVEKTDYPNPTFISLKSDGAGAKHIVMPGGGYRKPSSAETLQERVYEDGSIRTEEHGSMDGAAIFNFTITEVPSDIKNLMLKAKAGWDEIDYFVPHQANRFITDHIARKFKVPAEKVLYSLQKYGNTSSVSIPLTIVSELGDTALENVYRLLLCGFGVGLSWGNVITELHNCRIARVCDYSV
jgi:3-oxoacyl-[acyl-carrier-protein] synthase III